MESIFYEDVIVLGVDELAAKCAVLIKEFGIPTIVFDTNKMKSMLFERQLRREDIEYKSIPKSDLFYYLSSLNSRVLIISAGNPYLIPKNIVNKKNITAINCHHALLPNHPGRNAEAWAIYDQDSFSGITWHFISPEVDAGNIIAQKQVTLGETITSIRLLKIQKEHAYESFLEIIENVLNQDITGYAQELDKRGKIHFSWEVPNNGEIDLNWDGKKVSAFLRSMDYGVLEVLGKPRILYSGQYYLWKRYEIIFNHENDRSRDSVVFLENQINLIRDRYKFILSNYFSLK